MWEPRDEPRSSHLRFEKLLGEGGQCRVWAVADVASGRREALRVAREDVDDAGLLERHRSGSGRRHPNVVAHLGLTRLESGALGMRTELVADAPRLSAAELDPSARAAVALGVASGVAAIHGWDLLHGDLSPENVLLAAGPSGQLVPRLVDWGVDPEGALPPLTPGYAAPERLDGRPPSRAADVYALGCVVHEILTGRPLWPGAVPNLDPPLDSSLPAPLAMLLLRALEWRAADRPAAATFRAELAVALGVRRSQGTSDREAPRPLSEGARSATLGALDALRGLARGEGSVVSLRAAPDADRGEFLRWLADEAAAAGAIPYLVRDAASLSRALGGSPAASRDPGLGLALALDAAAVRRPRVVLVDAPDPEAPPLTTLYDALRTASRAGPVLAVVDPVAGLAERALSLPSAHPATPPELDGAAPLELSDVEAAVLATLWAAEQPLSPHDLERLAGAPADPVRRSVTALEDRRLVRVAGEVSLLHHSLARRAARGLPEAARRALHERLSEWSHPGLDFGERALRQARHALLASDEARPQLRVEVADALAARGQARAALAILDGVEHPATRVARAAILLSQGAAGEAREALREVEPGEDDALRVRVCALLGRCGDHQAALDLLEGAVRDPAGWLELARASLGAGDEPRASSLARRLLEGGDLPASVEAGAWLLASGCAWRRGDPDEAERLALSGLDRAAEDRPVRADLLLALGLARFYQGRQEDAARALAQAVTENRAMGRLPELARCLASFGRVDDARGRFARAAGTFEELRVLYARVGDDVGSAEASEELGRLYVRLGQPERAAQAFRRCVRAAREAGLRGVVPRASGSLGSALLEAGDLVGADAALREAAGALEAAGIRHGRAELRRLQAELLMRRGDADAARTLLGALLAQPGEDLAFFGRVRRSLAECERRLGHAERAVELARVALRNFDDLGDRFERALGREVLARALWDAGDPFAGAHEAGKALDVHLALGGRSHADRVCELHEGLLEATSSAGRDVASRRALLEVAHHLGGTLDLEELAPLVLEKVVSLVEAERGVFALLGPDGQLAHAVTHGLEWDGPGTPLPVSSGLVSQVLAQEAPVVVQDVEGELSFGARRSVRLLGLRSMVGVPVQHGGRLLGVLYVDSRRRGLGEVQRDKELLTAFAALVGVCVENARLFAEQRFRADLLSQMAHDFRAPLTAVKANAELVSDPAMTEEDVEEMIGEIRASAVRMGRMVDDTLELARADAPVDSAPEQVPVGSAVRAHLRTLEVLARQYEVGLELDADDVALTATTYPDRVFIVLDNLVFNALKHAPVGSSVAVSVRGRADAGPERTRSRAETIGGVFRADAALEPAGDSDFVEISVHNLGPPISSRLRDHVFEAYARGERSRGGVKSTGLGLAIVDRCVTSLGGRAWVESDVGVGTTFHFTLPRRLSSGGVVGNKRTA